MGHSKKILISWRNHGRDHKYFFDYVIDSEDFERDMEVLRFLENSHEESQHRDGKLSPRNKILRNMPAVVMSGFLKYCIGEGENGWIALGQRMRNALEQNTIVEPGIYDLENDCYQLERIPEAQDLYKKLDTKEMYEYWKRVCRRPDNSFVGTTGEVYHISFTGRPSEDFHCLFDQPSIEFDIRKETAAYRKRNRAKAFHANEDYEGAI